MDIFKLLRPKKVAVIGASEKSGFGGDTCRNIIKYQSNIDNVYFVNPKQESIMGKKCYKSISEIDDEIDLAVICTSQKTVVPLLKEAKTKGVGGAVVYASGYSEVGDEEGKEQERNLIEAAKELDIAVMGPNCGGYINFIDSTFSFAFVGDYANKKGKIGFISQSGQFCIDMLKNPEMKYSYAISAGNSRIVQMEDYMNFLLEDEDTKVIAMYLEGVKNPIKFEECLRKAAQIKKPIVILKAGRSPKGQETAASHTGSMAGSDKTYDAIFEKFGVIRVDDMQDLRSTSAILATLKTLPKNNKFGAMCVSGGETAVSADTGYMYGIEFPNFSHETLEKLSKLLPPYATPRNPLDMTSTLAYNTDRFADGITGVMSDENVDMCLIGFTISENVTVSNEIMFEGIKKASERMDKPIALMSFMETSRNKEFVERFINIGIPVLPTTKYGFSALKHLVEFVEYTSEDKDLELAIPDMTNKKETIALSEYASKKMLSDYGVNVDLGMIVTSKEQAICEANKIGYPLVMKIESADILHKSDVGGVKLNIRNEKEVKNAYEEIMSSVSEKAPKAKINGILMQKMLNKGTEMIVGLNNDPQFGPMILVGMGGVFVEVFKDVSLYPVPLNKKEAEHMIKSLKSFKLLNGYRGGDVADIDALTEMIVSISDFAYKNKDNIKELDINPLFVYPEGEGVGIADALIVLNQ